MKHLKLYEEILFSKNRKLYNTILDYIKNIDPESIRYEENNTYSNLETSTYSIVIKSETADDDNDPWGEELNKNDIPIIISKHTYYSPPFTTEFGGGEDYFVVINNKKQDLYQHEIRNLYNKLERKYLKK